VLHHAYSLAANTPEWRVCAARVAPQRRRRRRSALFCGEVPVSLRKRLTLSRVLLARSSLLRCRRQSLGARASRRGAPHRAGAPLWSARGTRNPPIPSRADTPPLSPAAAPPPAPQPQPPPPCCTQRRSMPRDYLRSWQTQLGTRKQLPKPQSSWQPTSPAFWAPSQTASRRCWRVSTVASQHSTSLTATASRS